MLPKKKTEEMKVRPKALAKNLGMAGRIAKRNGGKLPNPWKLIEMGHGSLYQYIGRHRKHFAHLKFDQAVQTEASAANQFNVAIRQEHLKLAKKLAKQNHGMLPRMRWLTDHGYTRLVSYVRVYPQLFEAIKCNRF